MNLENIEYNVQIGTRKFRISTEDIMLKEYVNSNEKDLMGIINLEQVLGKEEILLWKGNWKNPFKFEKKEREKTKLLTYIYGESISYFIEPLKLNEENFDKFYDNIERAGKKHNFSYPSKKNAELFFAKLFNHYKEISDKFLK